MTDQGTILSRVSAIIRATIAEDWLDDIEIGPGTRFHDDLEIESIEFIRIADVLQSDFGPDLDLAGWLSGRTMQQLIGLSVGDICDAIAASGLRV